MSAALTKEKSKYVIAGTSRSRSDDLHFLCFNPPGTKLVKISSIELLEGVILVSSGALLLLAVLIIESKAKKIKSFLSENACRCTKSSNRLILHPSVNRF